MTAASHPARAATETVARRWPFLAAHGGRLTAVREAPGAVLAVVAGTRLVGLGDVAGLAGLLAAEDLPAVDGALLTRGTHGPATERLGLVHAPGRDWDWLVCDAAPPRRAGEERVGPVAEAAEVAALLARAYPDREEYDDGDHAWYGYRLPGGPLAGVVAVRDDRVGRHLSAVATDPAHRRRGVAAAMTARLTRAGLARGRPVHLGIWATNDAARRLYAGLGFRVAHELETLRRAP